MAGLNNIREAYEQVYAQLDERMDPEERALRRAEVADRKASRMDSKVADKYAGSEAQSAARADKKSKGKHIHGMADSYEVEGDLVDEGKSSRPRYPGGRGVLDQERRDDKRDAAAENMRGHTSGPGTVTKNPKKFRKQKAMGELTKEEMIVHLQERALDYAEKKEKESVYKAIKPSKLAKTYPEKSPEELKKLRYAISTSQAKKNMDTSRSDKRYGVER